MHPERLRREADVRFDQSGLEANAARDRIDVGTGSFQHCAGLVVQEVDADLLEYAERRLMDRFLCRWIEQVAAENAHFEIRAVFR